MFDTCLLRNSTGTYYLRTQEVRNLLVAYEYAPAETSVYVVRSAGETLVADVACVQSRNLARFGFEDLTTEYSVHGIGWMGPG